MKIAYLDCSSGVSGDMFLGACLDAGLPVEQLQAELAKLRLGAYEFRTARVLRGGIAGMHVEIAVPGAQPERHLEDIAGLIRESVLGEPVKRRAIAMFTRLAEVEGKLHAKPANRVHFHEVGAVDAILDIVGAAVAVELLGISELICSPLNVGGGRVAAAHGSLPVPAPATAELLRGAPVYSSGVEAELVTPTGAVIVTTLASGFGPVPPMKLDRIGYGAGARDFPGWPNLVRLLAGDAASNPEPRIPNRDGDKVAVIEANVDDMSPQVYGYFVERALEAGALDVTCSPVQMKKNRPGLAISLMCAPEGAIALAEMLFQETTTIGVRVHEARRMCLEREVVTVETEHGPVRVKVARRAGKVVNVAPEYEDCQRLARKRSVPLKEVMLAAQVAYSRKD
ncbi:MAG TPA: nickel pincer cofactor biosynthesis protein LarC [Terriglobia bacterium]|nr:nickel pincer cofactor biosynthesis protein LarC [Terriglobia bacterium]